MSVKFYEGISLDLKTVPVREITACILFFKVDGNEQTGWIYSYLLLIKVGGGMPVFLPISARLTLRSRHGGTLETKNV